MQVDTIITNCKELLTIQGNSKPKKGKEMNDLGILNNVDVIIHNGKIVDIIQTSKDKYKSEVIIDASEKVVMPGFVDPHTHPVFVKTRENEFEMRILGKSYVEISQSGGGIRSSISDVHTASEDKLYLLAKKRIQRMVEMGTTSFEAKSGYGLSTQSELKMLQVIDRLNKTLPVDIKITFLGAHEYPEKYKNDHEKYISILCNEMIPAVKSQNIATYCDIFCEKHVFSVNESRRILQTAEKSGFKLKLHADEIEAIGGAELAAELKAVSADHLGAASDKGIKAMAEAGVIAVLLPATIFSLGLNSYARARKMIDLDLPVALATDFNPGSCNCDSMQMVVTLACLQMKMTVAEAICAATYNAACAIELQNQVGSIEVGKQADILIMDMPSYRYLPYHFGSSNVETVFKNGSIIFSK